MSIAVDRPLERGDAKVVAQPGRSRAVHSGRRSAARERQACHDRAWWLKLDLDARTATWRRGYDTSPCASPRSGEGTFREHRSRYPRLARSATTTERTGARARAPV